MCLDSEQAGQKEEAVRVELVKALDDLKKKLAIGEELELVWRPTVQGPLSGEIKENQILVYEADENRALETISHEIIDHLITTKIVRPLVKIINLLVKSAEVDIYQAKEEVIKKLVGLCSQTTGGGGAVGIRSPRAESNPKKRDRPSSRGVADED
jgi:hypothetical protein